MMRWKSPQMNFIQAARRQRDAAFWKFLLVCLPLGAGIVVCLAAGAP